MNCYGSGRVGLLDVIAVSSLRCGLFFCATIPPLLAQPPAQPPSREAWRESMVRFPPAQKGCFKASYPTSMWQPVDCVPAPQRPYRPRRGIKPNIIGNGNDFAAQTSGLISTARGSFDSVTGVTSDSDLTGQSPFSLQLNTNFFETSVCSSALTPSACSGWQQFVFSDLGVVFMQYWLIDYGTACPMGWNADGSDCWRNGNALGTGTYLIGDLASLGLAGQAGAGGTDTATLLTPSGDVYAVGEDTVLDLQLGWHVAEFNVFGDCCGTQTAFNNGSSIVVETNINDGTTNAPTCAADGFTGETNNLTLVQTCCPYGGSSPGIKFMESNVAGQTLSCSAAISPPTSLSVVSK